MTDSGKNFHELSADELRRLSQEEPEQFAKLAQDAIEAACVGKTVEQTLRLKRMQWVIEGSLRKARTPLQRLQVMEEIFYGKVYGNGGLLVQLSEKLADVARHIKGSRGSGVEFPRRVPGRSPKEASGKPTGKSR